MTNYTLEQLQKMGATPIAPTAAPNPTSTGAGMTLEQLQKMGATPIASDAKPAEKSTLEKVGDFVAPSLTRTIKKGRAGEDITARDYIGSALEVGSFVLPVGAVARGVGMVAKGAGLAKKGLAARSLEAGTVGAVSGGMAGAGREVGAGGSAAEIAKATITGGVLGGAFGGALPVVGRGVRVGAEKVGELSKAIQPVAQGAFDITKIAGQGLSRIPSRIGVNVAEKQAVEKTIMSLPSKTAQVAVRDGVDIVDAKILPELVKTPEARTLIKTVKDFAGGNKAVDPIEIVGRPIIARVKELDKARNSVGAKLGAASKNIGILTKPELQNGVILRLKQVPGLENVTVKANGTLDFKGTTFGSTLSRADKNAVQEAFREATKWGDGEKAHMFRQTLFENLGGKKRSLANITDTHEKALEAIRKGLSDVIEPKNADYKKLSIEYAKIVDPLSKLRKLMKNIDPNSDDDILNMSAGLLARRITSAAPSNPQIRQLLQALDDAGEKGATRESVTKMQDLYNILNKNYDIAPKTGFQNLVKEGTAPTGLYEAVSGAVKGFAGNTNAVRQASLEKYLEELLKASKP